MDEDRGWMYTGRINNLCGCEDLLVCLHKQHDMRTSLSLFLQWREEGGEEKCRLPNGILGVLVRWHFPGMATCKDGKQEPALKWQNYKAAEDTPDEDGTHYDNCLQWVEESFWGTAGSTADPTLASLAGSTEDHVETNNAVMLA